MKLAQLVKDQDLDNHLPRGGVFKLDQLLETRIYVFGTLEVVQSKLNVLDLNLMY